MAIFGTTKENGGFIMEITGEYFAYFFIFPVSWYRVCFLIIVFGNQFRETIFFPHFPPFADNLSSLNEVIYSLNTARLARKDSFFILKMEISLYRGVRSNNLITKKNSVRQVLYCNTARTACVKKHSVSLTIYLISQLQQLKQALQVKKCYQLKKSTNFI